MKKVKYIGILFLSLALLFVLTACGKTDSSKNIQYSYNTDLETLDSTMASDATSINTLLNVEEGLIRADKNNQPQLALAKSLSVSKDQLTYTFTLRPNLKWSNGDKLTAKDFVYAWQRGVDPKTGSEYASSLSPVKNADEIMAKKLPVTDLGVKAVSDNTLVVTLKQPTPYFEWLLTTSIYFPLDRSFVEKEGKTYGTTSAKTLYNGPYKMATGSKGWNGSNKTYTFIKNDNYYDAQAVKSKEIDIQIISNTTTAVQLYKEKKLDLAFLDTPSLISANKSQPGFSVIAAPRTDLLEFNQTGAVPALKNLKIRQAISLAINREGIIKAGAPYFKAAQTVTPLNLDKTPSGEDFAKYAAQPYSYDAKKAAQLWAEGLKELGLKSLKLTLEGDSDSAFYKSTVEYLQGSLPKELPGLSIDLKLVPKQQRMQDGQNGNFQLILSSWGADYNEPSDFLGNYVTGGAFNNGKFSNPAYDKAYKAATSEPDILNPEARYADYKKAEQALYEQANLVPIDSEAKPVLINPNIKGLSKLSSGLIYDLKTAYLK